MPPDHYETLGIAREATPDEVRAAYRTLAKAHHPDRVVGDAAAKAAAEARFKAVGEAYGVLKDGEARAAYDRTMAPRAQRPAREEVPVWEGADQWWPEPSDFVARPWSRPPPPAPGPRPSPAQPRPGAWPRPDPHNAPPPPPRPDAISAEVAATLEELFRGFGYRLGLAIRRGCPACHGLGRMSTGSVPCPVCGGRRRGLFGFGSECATCYGLGRVAQVEGCSLCAGAGMVAVTMQHVVPVPPGTPDGTIIEDRLPDGRGLRLTVRAKRHRRLACRGHDLVLGRKVAARRVDRGTVLTVTGINGARLRVKVRPGTADGTLLRVAGHGMPLPSGGRGDLLVRLQRT